MRDIYEVFDMLQEPSLDINRAINELQEFYDINERHEYSTITKIVLQMYNTSNDDEIEALGIVQENIDSILNSLSDLYSYYVSCEGHDREFKETKKLIDQLKKLKDHIELEIVRFEELMKQTGDLRRFQSSLRAERIRTDRMVTKMEEQLIDSKKQSDDFGRVIEDHEQKLKEQQTQFVAILGIFAAIVVAFTGGMAFSTSVLENIDAITPYRLIGVVSVLALVLINTIYLMVWMIFKITEKETTYPKWLKFVDVALIVLIVAMIGIWVKYGDTIVLDALDNTTNNLIRIKIK